MNNIFVFLLICTISFLSGVAALTYEICWFRSLSLVLGGAQIAVTTTISIFMLGLAAGSWVVARQIRRFNNLLFLYGFLEIGIALSAGFFILLMKVYPQIYSYLAGLVPHSLVYLTAIRVVFATVAMILPTMLMGATLPVLTACVARNPQSVAGSVSFIYGFNTLGAAVGVIGSVFFLLRFLPVSMLILLAIGINVLAGILSFIIQGRYHLLSFPDWGTTAPDRREAEEKIEEQSGDKTEAANIQFTSRLVLWGIGISGFCALGYEVLWTKILILFLDATVYSFATILAAFLLGMCLGSLAYVFFQKITGFRITWRCGDHASAAVGFGLTQVMIGMATIFIMRYLFGLPVYTTFLQHYIFNLTGRLFFSHQFSNFLVALGFIAVPAFFMGLSVPLAGKVYSGWKKTTGRSVGELLAYNTFGAIFGGAVSGYVLLYFLGIERSLLALCLLNIGVGVVVIASLGKKKIFSLAMGLAIVALEAVLFFYPGVFGSWDSKFLATYTPYRAVFYTDTLKAQEQLDKHDLLYYAEGFESIVSSTLRRDTNTLQFTVNGRPEASTNLEDVQNQYMLGHLPMLLHRHPQKALVIGAGSGMTLAAVSSHPSVKNLQLVEIEPMVLGVARSFGEFNHNIVDHPGISVVFNDARNYLLGSTEMFDVITADPIHPTWRGSGYLYTLEYFRLAGEHLKPGGIMCQWLPLYLLSTENVRSIVNTFRQAFRYVQVWLTMADVQLVGSNEPIMIDIQDMERRIRVPAVLNDLESVFMGSAEDLLGYFLMGDRSAVAFSRNAIINRDDNVYLEFSSPLTAGDRFLEAANMDVLTDYRESIRPYLYKTDAVSVEKKKERIIEKLNAMHEVADRAQALYLATEKDQKALQQIRLDLNNLSSDGRLQSMKVGLFGY